VALLATLLAGCPLRPGVPVPPPPSAPQAPTPHAGVPYDIVAEQSLLRVLVYRGGTLANAGHNHVIASHALAGTVYVPADVLHASFEVRVPLATLTVDEAALRARELSPDFPPDVPESARQGTRRNMLGEALLDAAHYPQIVLRALGLEAQTAAAGNAAPGANTVLARVETTVRGQQRALTVPVSYRLAAGTLEVSAEFALRQSDLGLTPFTALLGALAVQDEMRVRLELLARPAGAR
jgi:polyisoprenoid-binding protein YceI